MKRDLKKRKLKEFYFNTENTEDSEKKNEPLYLSKEIFVYSVFSVFQKSCFHLYLEKMMRNKIFLNFTFGEKSSKSSFSLPIREHSKTKIELNNNIN